MAAAVRVRVGNITRNYVQTLLLQPHAMKIKQRVCFHNSAFLCGECCRSRWVYYMSLVVVLILIQVIHYF